MTLDEIVTAARSRAGDVDPAAYRYSLNEYTVVLKDLVRVYGLRNVEQMGTLVVDTTPGGETITPEPSDKQGLVLATAAALRVLQQTYRRRVDEGSLGVSWTSGLESESTISAGAAYKEMIENIAIELQEILLHINSKVSATRVQ